MRYRILLIIAYAFTLCSCVKDSSDYNTDGEGYGVPVKITIAAGETRSGQTVYGDPKDYEIATLRILGFRSKDGTLAFNDMKPVTETPQGIGEDVNWEKEFQVLTGQYTIVFIANEESDGKLEEQLENLPLNDFTLDDFKYLSFSYKAFDRNKKIPMAEHFENVTISGDNRLKYGDENVSGTWYVKLKRLAVWLNLKLTLTYEQSLLWEAAEAVNRAYNVYVENMPDRVYIFPNIDNTSSTRPETYTSRFGNSSHPGLIEMNDDRSYTITYPRIIIPETYFTESNNPDKAVRIETDLYDGAMRRVSGKIGLDLAKPDYTLPRNYYIEITGTIDSSIDNAEMKIEATVMDWDKKLDYQLEVDGDNWLYVDTKSIELDDAGAFTVRVETNLDEWTAELKDGTDETLPVDWLSGDNGTHNAREKDLVFEVDQNITGSNHTAFIDITAGRMTARVTVRYKPEKVAPKFLIEQAAIKNTGEFVKIERTDNFEFQDGEIEIRYSLNGKRYVNTAYRYDEPDQAFYTLQDNAKEILMYVNINLTGAEREVVFETRMKNGDGTWGEWEEIPTLTNTKLKQPLADVELVPPSNCYMVTPGKAKPIFIPVLAHVGRLFGEGIKGNGNISNVNLPDDWLTPKNHNFDATILWSDKPVGISDHTNDVVEWVQYIGNPSAQITENNIAGLLVKAGRVQGNTVVALFEDLNDNGVCTYEDPAVWTWHIWNTDYVADVTGMQGPEYPGGPNSGPMQNSNIKNGLVYGHNPGYDNSLRLIFMDRNLGAVDVKLKSDKTIDTSTDDNKFVTLGLYYQRGNKNPYPGSTAPGNNARKPLYGLHSPPVVTYEDVTQERNFINTFKFPLTFYGQQYNVDKNWYMGPYPAYQYQDSPYINGQLWGTAGDKTALDPCPAGWRVPHSADNNIWPFGRNGNATIYKSQFTVDDNKGRWITTDPMINIGWFPGTGVLDIPNGQPYSPLSNTGYYYTSHITWPEKSITWLHSSGHSELYAANATLGYGGSVRCVAE